MPRVSVVIPLFNTERYIAEAIASVRAQTFTDFEAIVVDDGSTDRGPTLARAVDDRRFRVVIQANRGLAGARNTGIREARGAFIALLDADDAWRADKLAHHVAILNGSPDVGISFSASALIDEAGRPLGLLQRPRPGPLDAARVFCRNPVGNGSAPVLRRAALDAVAFEDPGLGRTCWFDESFRQSEDIECWTRIAANTPWRFAFLDEPLTRYRVNAGGLSAHVGRQLETWRRFRAKVRGYAPALEAEYGDRAEAYQLRYLARRAIRSGDQDAALSLVLAAIRLSPRVLVEEPSRTLTTLAAAVVQRAIDPARFELVQQALAGLAIRLPALRP